jgi:hypothetical protein
VAYCTKQAKKHLDTIESFLYNEYSIVVEYGIDVKDGYYQEDKIVEINSRQNLNSRVHSLLHEAGHAIIRAKSKDSWSERFPYMKNHSGFARGNIKHRLDVFREEVLAWEEGKTLADTLSIKLDQEVFAKHRTAALKTYSDWI